MSRTCFIGLVILLVFPVWVAAAGPSPGDLNSKRSFPWPVYASVFADYQSIGIANAEIQTPVLTGVIGVWGWPGIGIEAELGKGVTEGDINNLALDVHSLTGFNLRLESPPSDGVAAYVLFGLSRTNLDSAFTAGFVGKKKNSLSGGRAAIGLTLRAARGLVVDASFSHHDYDDEIRINSFRLGLRYNFVGEQRW